MSKKQHVPIKPTTKESYAMPKAQTSNRFEVLGQLSKAKSSNPSKPVYLTKETKLIIKCFGQYYSSTASYTYSTIILPTDYII